MMHIQQFIDKVQGADMRNQRDFSMTLREAKDLHADITRLVLELLELKKNPVKTDDEVVTIELNGGTF